MPRNVNFLYMVAIAIVTIAMARRTNLETAFALVAMSFLMFVVFCSVLRALNNALPSSSGVRLLTFAMIPGLAVEVVGLELVARVVEGESLAPLLTASLLALLWCCASGMFCATFNSNMTLLEDVVTKMRRRR